MRRNDLRLIHVNAPYTPAGENTYTISGEEVSHILADPASAIFLPVAQTGYSTGVSFPYSAVRTSCSIDSRSLAQRWNITGSSLSPAIPAYSEGWGVTRMVWSPSAKIEIFGGM